MVRSRFVPILIAAAVVGSSLMACTETSGGYTSQRAPSSLEIAARETAVARETLSALDSGAAATRAALDSQAQATRQVMDAQGTAMAQAAQATRQAWEFQQTVEAADVMLTVTAEARQATATAVQWEANVQATRYAAQAQAIEATAQAVARASERERVTQPLRAWWAWALLAVAVPFVGWCGWRMAKVIEDRARVVRRRADEGEPFMMEQDRDGTRRIVLPLRSFNALMDTGDVPALPAPELQNEATMRQQVSNALQARQVGRIAQAKSKHQPQIVTGSARALPRPRRAPSHQRRVPGLVRVVPVTALQEATSQGILPPRLATAIEGQWTEVEEDEI
jgi:hypothetical protein